MKTGRVAALTLTIAAAMTVPSITSAEGEIPRSSLPGVKSIETVQQMVMPEIDLANILAEDAVRENSGLPVAPRFAKAMPVSFSPNSTGTWETLDDGSKVWRLRIASPGALSLNLGLERFDLPAGAKFWIHDADGAQVQGPYKAQNRNNAGGLWTAVVLGDELVAELHLPVGSDADLKIVSVNHGYRFFGESAGLPGKKEAAATSTSCVPTATPGETRSVRWLESRSPACTSVPGS